MFKTVTLITIISLFSSGYAAFDGCDMPTRPYSITVGADWLYWKVTEDNLEYASEVSAVTSGDTTIRPNILSPPFEARSGFRLFSAYSAYDCPWELGLNFVHLYSKSNNSTHLDPANIESNFIVLNSQTFPLFNAVNSNNIQFSNLDAFWDVNFNYFDFDLSYTFCVCSFLKLTPNMGLRGMWIKQKLQLEGVSPSQGGGTLFSNFVEHFDGYGFKAGLTAAINLGCRFSLIGNIGGSILYAKIKVDENLIISTGQGLNIEAKERSFHSSPTINTFIGVNYQNIVCCHPYNLHIGWEQHVIFNVNHLSLLDYANLTMQGLTLGGDFSF